jgi:alkylation response protein AidB-like acyl-CoA dehydrogenase
MKFELTDLQASWKSKGEELGGELPLDASPGEVVMGAARVGLLDARADLVSIAAAVESVAYRSASAGVAIALHTVVASACAEHSAFADALLKGELIGALTLSSEDVPIERGGRLTGRASWVAPITSGGLALVGARTDEDAVAFAVSLASRGVWTDAVEPAGLRGLACAHLIFEEAEAVRLGPTVPLMSRVRVLMAAVGLGIGQRALAEALVTARAAGGGAAGEQTVQGLLADAATELDAARLLTWKAAAADGDVTLGDASTAKLAATDAAQRAVVRATQVIGVETFRRNHIIERLAQDVRALELFAGRTESLRAAVAAEILPVADQSPLPTPA